MSMPQAKKKTGFVSVRQIRTYAILVVYVAIIGIFMITAPATFLNYRIYMAFLSTVPFALIMGLGLTFVVTAGEIDLSFPSTMALGGYVFASVFLASHNVLLALACCLVVGVVIGFINGVLIAKIGVPSIIATLSTMFIWAGLSVVISQGRQLVLDEARNQLLGQIFVGRIADILPAQSLWALGLAIIFAFILNRHRFGEHTMFVGDNREAARMLGVNVDRTLIGIFVLNGALAAFASVLLAVEMVTWWPTQGPGYLLTTVAAVFIGGTSIYGGEGTIFGTIVGSFIVGSITAGIVASGVGGFWGQLVVGLVMLVAILSNTFLSKRPR